MLVWAKGLSYGFVGINIFWIRNNNVSINTVDIIAGSVFRGSWYIMFSLIFAQFVIQHTTASTGCNLITFSFWLWSELGTRTHCGVS